MTFHEVHKIGRVGDLLSKSPTLFFPNTDIPCHPERSEGSPSAYT